MSTNNQKSSWSSRMGFILASAGSAVGLGNIWRFPYKAANGNGGLFLLIYILLTALFGFPLLISELAIGRKTGKSPIGAFKSISKETGKHSGFLGILGYIIPFIIYSYYVVIGGWITWYLIKFVALDVAQISASGYFGSFISSPVLPIICTLVYSFLSSLVVYKGVENGIEKFSKLVMPLLFIIIIGTSIFALTLKDPESGRTGLQGAKIYLVPSFKGLTFSGLLNIIMSAMSQLFYSCSIAMGIMITYGSYAKKEIGLESSASQIIFFDTFVAFLAGLLIIPSVFTFNGMEGLQTAGPSLIFVALPQIFNKMGNLGTVIGILFFFLVLFAALTSSISLLETIVSDTMNEFDKPRKKATINVSLIVFILSLVVCLGYSVWYFELTVPGVFEKGQILDVLDALANNVIMPILAFCTCIIVGWVLKPKWVIDEVTLNNSPFIQKNVYKVLIKWICPICLVLLFLNSTGLLSLIFK